MLSNAKTYRFDIDAIKGMSIIAVVLYHIGILKSGYLGVDAFFVINGYFIIPSVFRSVLDGKFKYFPFLKRRIVRLLPLVVIASALSLLLGYFLMLPDDYENVAQSIIAGCLFSSNILSSITIVDYWNVANELKPLMHLWYIGILFEFYLTLPIVFLLFKRIASVLKCNARKTLLYLLILLTFFSLCLYLSPGSNSHKFYYIQYRFFELGLGGLVGLIQKKKLFPRLSGISTVILFLLLTSSLFCLLNGQCGVDSYIIGGELTSKNTLPLPKNVSLLLVVLTTCFIIYNNCNSFLCNNKVLQLLGRISYSIFIWHQVFLAFYRYSFTDNFSFVFYLAFFIIVFLISYLSYSYVEKRVEDRHFIKWSVATVVLIIPSVWLYFNAGVVRDVPELDIKKGSGEVGMFAKYCDRVYDYDKDFMDSTTVNCLVVGNSFARDFANILLESEMRDSVEISYVYEWKGRDSVKLAQRCANADYIFIFSSKEKIPAYLWEKAKSPERIFGIGTKNFGSSNGAIYRKRNRNDYLRSTIRMRDGYYDMNERWLDEWGDFYVNLMKYVICENGEVRVFTDNGKFISQDCNHLTVHGARWYSSVLEWNTIFGN